MYYIAKNGFSNAWKDTSTKSYPTKIHGSVMVFFHEQWLRLLGGLKSNSGYKEVSRLRPIVCYNKEVKYHSFSI